MRINGIKFQNNHILKGLELDFVNQKTGKSYDNIVFAGENGTGKTTVLTALNEFLCGGTFEPFEFIRYDVDGTEYYAKPSLEYTEKNDAGYWLMTDSPDNSSEDLPKEMTVRRGVSNRELDNDERNVRKNGSVFSKARANYRTQPITSVTTQQIDISNADNDSADDFTELKQLIIDLERKDNSELSYRLRKGETISYTDFSTNHAKLFRFTSAFQKFFCGKINFGEVDMFKNESTGQMEIRVLFTKNGNSVSLDDLSTGEKQIIFRGTQLLRNKGNINGGFIMVDEPELSMHATWQKKILSYYTDLFSANGVQTAQMFFATHSEYVLDAALKDSENTIVFILSDDGGVITAKRIDAPFVLPTITAAEINYNAFNLPTIDYHIQLFGELQEKLRNSPCDSKCPSIDYNKITSVDSWLKCNSAPLQDSNWAKPRGEESLPAYIRNHIHHPTDGRSNACLDRLDESIKCLINFINILKPEK